MNEKYKMQAMNEMSECFAGVRPCWDDPVNKDGGRYVLQYSQRDRYRVEQSPNTLITAVLS